jgi:sulfur carrier protein ThiS
MDDGDKMARLTLRGQTYQVPAGMTVRAALQRSGISPESVIATRGGEMMTDDELLHSGDEVRLVAVISGGSGGAGPRGWRL